MLSNSPECVAQAVKTRLGLYLGEWFTDTSDGTDWQNRVLGERTNYIFEIELKQRILNTPGVDRIVDFSYSNEARRLSVSCTIDTIYGQTQVTA